MKLLAEYGKEELAKVYVASMRDDNSHLVEFVESVQPPVPRDEKWVLIVSSMFGCPIGCRTCDASGEYLGKLGTDEILSQIDYMVRKRYPDGRIPIPKLKVQFARTGEPSLNPNILDLLELLPEVYEAPGLMPCISTVAPISGGKFFERLIDIKDRLYTDGRFQLQFSIHTTDPDKRDHLMPARKWSFAQIADYGRSYLRKGDRKITLNFITIRGFPIDFKNVREHFDPDTFLVKLTPLNPTKNAMDNGFVSAIDPHDPHSAQDIVDGFRSQGFETILSIGEVEENSIGSNCGQFVSILKNSNLTIREGYESEKYLIVKN
ncbi:MAG: radical SAM protein [Thermoplasmata archaeon]|nr:radical SAM protein [Thermoplasmata archaeon]